MNEQQTAAANVEGELTWGQWVDMRERLLTLMLPRLSRTLMALGAMADLPDASVATEVAITRVLSESIAVLNLAVRELFEFPPDMPATAAIALQGRRISQITALLVLEKKSWQPCVDLLPRNLQAIGSKITTLGRGGLKSRENSPAATDGAISESGEPQPASSTIISDSAADALPSTGNG